MIQSLVRVLIPSWRFFDRVGPRLILQGRTRNSDWSTVVPQWTSSWNPLIFNPRGNLQLALQTLVERFVEEGQTANSTEEFEVSTTYQLTRNLIQCSFFDSEFQFRVLADEANVPNVPKEIYISSWLGSND